MPQFYLSVLLLLVIIAIYIWDAWAMSSGVPSETVSTIVRGWSEKQPILAFAVGLLIGHIFW
jgi:hypothetical protein